MDAPKEDRRIRRTKRMLRQGLAELMNEKDFKDITVKDITERVDLNRGTFYLHYTDTYDLLDKVENELIADFRDMIEHYNPTPENSSAFVIIDQVFDYIMENIDICRTLILSDSNSRFLQKIMDVIIEKGFQILRQFSKTDDPVLMEYSFRFISYGLVGVLKSWMEDGMKVPRLEIAAMLNRLIIALHTSFQQN